MAATVEDHDYPKRAAHKLGVSEDAALALESHVDQYADMKVLNELRRSDRSFGALGGMGFQPGAGETADMDMQGESTAAALSGSTPAKILHYILTYLFRKEVDHLLAKAFALELLRLHLLVYCTNAWLFTGLTLVPQRLYLLWCSLV